jgi:hypothetical protein
MSVAVRCAIPGPSRRIRPGNPVSHPSSPPVMTSMLIDVAGTASMLHGYGSSAVSGLVADRVVPVSLLVPV